LTRNAVVQSLFHVPKLVKVLEPRSQRAKCTSAFIDLFKRVVGSKSPQTTYQLRSAVGKY
jgi:hypothetical protein